MFYFNNKNMVSKKSVYKKSKKSKTLKRKYIPKSKRKYTIKKGGMNFEDVWKSINSSSSTRNSPVESLGSFGDLGSLGLVPSIYHNPKTRVSVNPRDIPRSPHPVVTSKSPLFDPEIGRPARNRFLKESVSPIHGRSPAKRIRSLDDETRGHLAQNWSMSSLEGLKILDGWETLHTIEGLTIYKKTSEENDNDNIFLQLESPGAIVTSFKRSAQYDMIIDTNNKILDDIQEKTGKREFPQKLEDNWESYISNEGITIYYKIHPTYKSITQVSTIHPNYIGNPEFVLKVF